MEIMKIVGKRHVDFTDDKGRVVKGYSLYYSMKSDGVEGEMTGKMFLSDEKVSVVPLPPIGSTVEVLYDRYGRASKFTVIK